MEKIKIGALISGSGTNMQAIDNACAVGEINGDVIFVGSDNLEAKGLAKAKEKGIPVFAVDYGKIRRSACQSNVDIPHEGMINDVWKKSRFIYSWFKGDVDKQLQYLMWKITAEQQLLEQINEYEFDLLVLAGFMQICTPFFIDAINTDPERPRIMNIHPALLPSFPGEHGYEDTYNHGCKVGGCTVHFLDYGEDTGPIIDQRAIAILPGDSLADFKRKGLRREWELYPHCVRLFAEDRLKIVKGSNGRKIVKIKTAKIRKT